MRCALTAAKIEMTKKMIRTYNKLKQLETFEERYQYLRLVGMVGESTFGYDRYLNQALYRSRKWRAIRDLIIIRDEGCDLGIADRLIFGRIVIHHMNPLTFEDIEEGSDLVFDPEYLICTSHQTHNAIHFGDESQLIQLPKERTRNDTIPWA